MNDSKNKPRPVEDWLVDQDPALLFAKLGVGFGLLALLADAIPLPVWVYAMSLVFALGFGVVASMMLFWRRFKQWRYPSYYDGRSNDER